MWLRDQLQAPVIQCSIQDRYKAYLNGFKHISFDCSNLRSEGKLILGELFPENINWISS